MQLQSSNCVHKCIAGGYWLRIKNYAGMRRVSEYDKNVKNSPQLHYVGAYLHLHRVDILFNMLLL